MTTTNIALSRLRPFEDHPYQVRDDEEMQSRVDSIKESGVLSPVIVRPLEDGDYEIISGHRRCHAAEKAGLTSVPAAVLSITHEEAVIALVDSNLHREHLLPSEKAFAYKMKSEAMKHQGKKRIYERFMECITHVPCLSPKMSQIKVKQQIRMITVPLRKSENSPARAIRQFSGISG